MKVLELTGAGCRDRLLKLEFVLDRKPTDQELQELVRCFQLQLFEQQGKVEQISQTLAALEAAAEKKGRSDMAGTIMVEAMKQLKALR